jgi:hypothetical protein
VALITVVSCSLIGVTYSLLRRSNPYEEVAAKACTSILMVYLGERLKKDDEGCADKTCRICFEETSRSDCMVLKCRHRFH